MGRRSRGRFTGWQESGRDAEAMLAGVLALAKIPYMQGTQEEDEQHKIDFWVWDERERGWYRLQLTIAKDVDVLMRKQEHCARHDVAFVRLAHADLMAAHSGSQQKRRQGAEKVVRSLMQQLAEAREANPAVMLLEPSVAAGPKLPGV